jgi:non-ribosomal peptide synthetase component F
VGEQRRVTPFIVLLTAFQVMLGRYARQEDVAVGTPAAGRTRSEFERLVGPLGNTLILRTDLSGDPTLDEVLDRVRTVALGAYDNQHGPVDELGTGDPLIRTMVTYLARTPLRSRLGALAVDVLDAPSAPSVLDLVLTVDDQGPEPVATIQYATGLFDRSTVEGIAGDYLAVIQQVLEAPDRPLSAVTLTGERLAAVRTVVAGSPRFLRADHVDVAAIEEVILRVWRELLSRDDIGPQDNFFDAGGHSHLLVEVQHRLAGQVSAQLRIVDFFRHPTVRALAAHVAAQQQAPAGRVEQEGPEQDRHFAGRRESLGKQRARHRAKSARHLGEERNAGRV